MTFSLVKIPDATSNDEDNAESRVPSSNDDVVVASDNVDDASVATSSSGSANAWRWVEEDNGGGATPDGDDSAPCNEMAVGAKADDGAPDKINDDTANKSHCILLLRLVR